MMWKDRYCIGVDRIDQQHKELFNRVYEFINVTNESTDWKDRVEKVKETINFMKEYVVYHFNDEEDLMEEINYPEIEAHIRIHKKFKAGINNYVDKLKSGDFDEETVQEFGGKIMTWLIFHVGHADQKIGEYVKSQKGDK